MRARRRPAKARNISACKHWLSGLLRCSVCGATLSLAGSGSYRYFQCWKYSKGFHKGSQSLSAAKAEAAVCDYFDRILAGADFTYTVRNISDQKESDELDLLRQELDQIAVKEARVKLAYENGIDTLEEYKENRRRLKESRGRTAGKDRCRHCCHTVGRFRHRCQRNASEGDPVCQRDPEGSGRILRTERSTAALDRGRNHL